MKYQIIFFNTCKLSNHTLICWYPLLLTTPIHTCIVQSQAENRRYSAFKTSSNSFTVLSSEAESNSRLLKCGLGLMIDL